MAYRNYSNKNGATLRNSNIHFTFHASGSLIEEELSLQLTCLISHYAHNADQHEKRKLQTSAQIKTFLNGTSEVLFRAKKGTSCIVMAAGDAPCPLGRANIYRMLAVACLALPINRSMN
ncbi:hypothetical protein NTGM5_100008 [Candidatus Nitrotoga sp. M5]|nr:hypothetical protein NTGM5_100008 [Candidatus Nitrotoga sp. M5]